MSFWKRLWRKPEQKLTIRQLYLKLNWQQEQHLMSLKTYRERKEYIEDNFPIEEHNTISDTKLLEEMFTPLISHVYDAHNSYEGIFTMFQNYRNIAKTTSAGMTFSEKKQFLNSSDTERQALMKTLSGQEVPALTKFVAEQVVKDLDSELASIRRTTGGEVGTAGYFGYTDTGATGDSGISSGDAGGGSSADSGGF